jgi:hypothetical protein
MTMGDRVELVLAPRDCTHFDKCSAAICPLDPAWRRAVHLEGERVCHYLRVGGKAGAAAFYASDPVFVAAQAEAPAVFARHGDVRRQAERSARTRLKGRNLSPRAVAGTPPGGVTI